MTRAFKNQGFTFIEIMLVILVIAVLGALILPDLSRSIRESAEDRVAYSGLYREVCAVAFGYAAAGDGAYV